MPRSPSALPSRSAPRRGLPTASLASRRRRLVVAALLCLGAGAALPASGAAASRVEVIEVPSTRGNIDLALTRTRDFSTLQARVLLPDGYDEQPGRRWPVVYLLHGVGDTSASWLRPDQGDAQAGTAGLPAIVVMPEGGRGYWIDHYLGNTDRLGARWASYVLEEVVPAIEGRYRIAPGRTNHVLGGLSMGGYGAAVLGAQLPGYFGRVVSFSGLYNVRSPAAVAFVPYFSALSYARMWGRPDGPYSRAVNPIDLLGNLRHTPLYLSAGNGLHDPSTGWSLNAMISGGATELLGRLDTERFVRSARHAGLDLTVRAHSAGTHSWGYWRRELRQWTATRPFGDGAAPDDQPPPTSFTYRTMQPAGNAWGVGFRFSQRPRSLITITRDGQQLTLAGSGTVGLSPGSAPADATGTGGRPECRVTVSLPARLALPPGC